MIEDHADTLEMLVLLLESGGYDVVAAESPQRASRALEKGSFDLVLTDLLLESKDVEDSWRKIDEFVDLAYPSPVGVMSGGPVKPERDVPRRGVAFVLRKPYTRDQLFTELATTLALPELDGARLATLRSYFRCIEQGAYDELGNLCADDVVYRLPGSDPRFCQEIHGRRELIEFTAQTFQSFRQPRFELGAIRPLPNGAMVEYVGIWHQDDEIRRMPGAVMFQFRDDLLATIQVRVDTDELA